MLGVFRRYLKDKMNTLIGFAIGAVAFLEMYVALFPSIQETSAQLNELIKTYPDAFFKAFGMEKSDLAFSTVESYLATEQFSFMWPILAVILATSMANAIAVNDTDKGTVEFVMAQPISRTKLFLSRYLAGLLALLAFTAVSIYCVVPLFSIHNISYDITKFNTVALVSACFITAVYSLAAFFSAVFSDKGKTNFLVGGTVILMYVFNIVSSLKESLENLKYISLFYYFSPQQALMKGEIVKYATPVMLGFSVVMVVLAVLAYDKKDLV